MGIGNAFIRASAICAVLLASGISGSALDWTTDFASNPRPVLMSGSASYQTINGSRCMRLTPNSASQTGWFMVNQNCAASGQVDWFDVRWTQCLDPFRTDYKGRGVCFAFGPFGTNPDLGDPWAVYGVNPGLKVIWRQDQSTLTVSVNGKEISTVSFDCDTGAVFRICRVTWWRASGRLRVNCYAGATQIDTSVNLNPEPDWKFDWGGSGGTVNWGQTAIDDIVISTGTNPGIPYTNLTLTNANPITWYWTAPSDYGSALSGYDINISNGAVSVNTGTSTAAAYACNVPSSGYWYSGQVRAWGTSAVDGTAMESTWSSWSAGTLFDNQAPVSGTIYDEGAYKNNGTLNFAWDNAIDPGGSGLSQYYITLVDEAWNYKYQGYTGLNTSYQFTGGEHGHSYALVVWPIDNAGNWGNPGGSDWITVDTRSPERGTCSCPAVSNASPISISYSGASDSPSGIQGVYLWARKDGGEWAYTGIWSGSASGTFNYPVTQGDGQYYFWLDVNDNAGNSTPNDFNGGNGDCGVLYDTAGSTGSITINDGAETTANRNVIIAVSASDTGSGVSRMAFSNDGYVWSAWEVYAVQKNWTLAGNNGLKTVYAKFSDSAGNESGAVFDVITLAVPVNPGQKGVVDGTGLNNIGKLIKIAGRFGWVGSSEFMVDDGSYPISVIVPAGVVIDPNWTYVAVTGVSSTRQDEYGALRRVVRVRCQADIQAL